MEMKAISLFGWMAVLAAGPLTPTAVAQEPTILYRAVVELGGTIEARMIPVNPESIAPDRPMEKRYFLHLEKPVAVTTEPNGDKQLNPPEANVTVLQLMSDAAPEKAIVLNALLEESVAKKSKLLITGALFHASTVHHFTPVLMEIAEIKIPAAIASPAGVPAISADVPAAPVEPRTSD